MEQNIQEIRWNNINHLIKDNANRLKNKNFLIFGDNNSKDHIISYLEFEEITNKTANLLLSLGIKKHDKVSTILENSLELIYLMFASFKIGAVFNPLNPKLSTEELKYLINDAESKIVFVNQQKELGIKGTNSTKFIDIKKFKQELKTQQTSFNPTEEITIENEALLIYSSGTTAKPKGIILTQKNLLSCSMSVARFLKLKEEMIILDSLPLFFSGGIIPTLFTTTCIGATVVVHEKFSKTKFWKRIEKYKINWTLLVPTMTSILLNPPEDIKKYNLESLKYIISSAAPLPIEVLKKFEEEFNIPLFEAYGLSEDTVWTTMTPLDIKKRKIGSVGVEIDISKVRIVDDDDKPLESEKVGKIITKGPHIMKGYYKMPELTEQTIKKSWLYTGDLGYMDKEGYLYIVGREKELIIRGGENISPKEIDNVLYKHPAIADAAVAGIPDKIYGEEIAAFVILKENQEKTQEEIKTIEKEIIEHCKKHLAEYKCPKTVKFIKNIPVTGSGKVQRRKLAKLLD